MKNRINKDFVVILRKHEDKHLSFHKIEIMNHDNLVETMRNMCNDKSKTAYDIQQYFYSNYNVCHKYGHYYCYPRDYSASFVSTNDLPQKVGIDYTKKLKEECISVLIANAKSNGVVYSEEQLESKVNEFFPKWIKNAKETYADKYEKYLICDEHYRLIQEIKTKEDVVMYSLEDVGWNKFEYRISEDVSVALSTNFGYGSASYFLLKIIYKDIVIIPYSKYIYYSHCGMKHALNYTRAYDEESYSWNYALKYVEGFVNTSIDNPENFVKNYILNELDGMLEEIKVLFSCPEYTYKRTRSMDILKLDEYTKVKFTGSNSFGDDRYYNVFPEEFLLVYKTEYLTDSYFFISSLKKLKELSFAVDKYMDEIHNINKTNLPYVKEGIDNISNEIIIAKKERDMKYTDLASKKNELKIYNKEIEKIREKEIDDKEAQIENYIRLHPHYSEIIHEIEELESNIVEINKIIDGRSELRSRLRKCMDFAEKMENKYFT